MIQVSETNLSIDKDNFIRDHQSRIVEVEDWDTYCKHLKNTMAKLFISSQRLCLAIVSYRIAL